MIQTTPPNTDHDAAADQWATAAESEAAEWHHLPKLHSPFLTESELAVRWRRSKRTLQRWRKAAKGPGYVVAGGRILYPAEGVRAFERRHWHSGDV